MFFQCILNSPFKKLCLISCRRLTEGIREERFKVRLLFQHGSCLHMCGAYGLSRWISASITGEDRSVFVRSPFRTGSWRGRMEESEHFQKVIPPFLSAHRWHNGANHLHMCWDHGDVTESHRKQPQNAGFNQDLGSVRWTLVWKINK